MSHEKPFDLLLQNVRLATMQGEGLGLLPNAAMGVRDGVIVWIGPVAAIPAAAVDASTRQWDGKNDLVTPGLIDCHTHLIFAGNRAQEFEQRLGGASYEEIAQRGGGIRSTVNATRAAATIPHELAAAARARLTSLMQEGVTSIEIKSGYGLDTATELAMLRTARQLEPTQAINVVTTLLAAHAVPAEFAGRADDYIAFVCEEIIPQAHREGLADAVDVFCENIGFTLAQTRRVFDAARAINLPVKIHAEQLSNMGGAALAAEYGALSADHLEYLDDAGVRAMAAAGTVAVLLPGAFYYLRESQLPPIAALRHANVPIAVASDLNPGTSPIVSLQANMQMACTLFRLTPTEVLRGVTVNAARALGQNDRGTLVVGARADFCLWNVREPAELCYWLGGVRPRTVVVSGVERRMEAGVTCA